MLLHAHNSFTPIPVENKTTVQNVAGIALTLENRTVEWKTILPRALFVDSFERGKKESSIQTRENIDDRKKEKEKRKGERYARIRRAIKGAIGKRKRAGENAGATLLRHFQLRKITSGY